MNYLFSRTYETMAQLKYMVSLWTQAQQTAATLTDGEGWLFSHMMILWAKYRTGIFHIKPYCTTQRRP